MTSSSAGLGQVREQVGRALADFLARQQAVLVGIDEGLAPGLDAISELLAGGKRLRPAFCYWGWRAAGGSAAAGCAGHAESPDGADGGHILTAAAALELLHASALVHDDVMDRSATRRGRPTVHRRFAAHHAAGGWRGSADSFGTGAAILLGDLLLGWTGELFRASGLPADALRRGQPVLDAMRTDMIAGQYLDLLGQAAGTGTVASALRVVRYKSAKYTVEGPLLLGVALAPVPASTGAGATGTAAGTDSRLAAACTAYGIPLGVAFQLRDDVLGVFGDPAETGKPVTDDLREGKRTVLVALAEDRADPAQASVLRRHLGDPRLDEAAAARIRGVLTETGALAECERMIRGSVREALAALADAPFTSEAKTALAELAATAVDRAD
jgi:geranylgeranyl diphosphate synthase type I